MARGRTIELDRRWPLPSGILYSQKRPLKLRIEPLAVRTNWRKLRKSLHIMELQREPISWCILKGRIPFFSHWSSYLWPKYFPWYGVKRIIEFEAKQKQKPKFTQMGWTRVYSTSIGADNGVYRVAYVPEWDWKGCILHCAPLYAIILIIHEIFLRQGYTSIELVIMPISCHAWLVKNGMLSRTYLKYRLYC